MAPRLRLMVALLLEGRVAAEIDGLRRGLGAGALERIGPHVTLVPPANVREDELDEALEAVRVSAAQCAPLRLELGPPASFVPRAPVVFLEVGGDRAELETLSEDLQKGPLAAPSGRKERAFVPHVTLDQRIDPTLVEPALAAFSHYRAVVMASRVSVLSLKEGERRWTLLADYELGDRHVVGRGGLEVAISLKTALAPSESALLVAELAPKRSTFSLVARVEGEIAGVLEAACLGAVCELRSIVVPGRWRRHGVGSKLLARAEGVALDEGASVVRLMAMDASDVSSFAKGRGYVVASSLGEDGSTLVLERHLYSGEAKPGG